MGGESGKRSEGRRRHDWKAMSRRRERAPRSQPPDGAKADGRGFGIGSKPPCDVQANARGYGIDS